MMRQYLEVKAERPDCLLLMRMGDFYEAFLADAVELSRITGVALTSRNKDSDEPIAMAGVPHHSLQGLLPKLLASGKRIAIMDQLEDPKEAAKDGRTLVRRGLARVISPGTLIDEMDSPAANHLVALTASDGVFGISALDVSTGRFAVEEISSATQLSLALARLQASELVVPETLRDDPAAMERIASALAPSGLPVVSTLPAFAWKAADARRFLGERLRVASLDGFGIDAADDHLASAAAAALRYAEGAIRHASDDSGQRRSLAHVRTIVRAHHAEYLVIDAACRRNLDLLRNSRDGGRDGTLLAAVDRTRTAPGARLLAEWLSRPLARVAPICARHDCVAALIASDRLRSDLRDALGAVYDLERLLSRVATQRCNARDLVQLSASLRAASAIRSLLSASKLPDLLTQAEAALGTDAELADEISTLLVEDPPIAIGDGGMVRDGVDRELDELRTLRSDAGAWLASYQLREAQACGLTKLKVGYNRVFGYYIEMSKANGDKVPAHFVRKQTLVGAERYITPELKEYEDKALGAEDRIRTRELALFTALRDRVASSVAGLQECASALAMVDVIAGLAEAARSHDWCRPLVDDSQVLELVGCRHPVIEQAIGRGRFVANDTALHAGSISGDHPRLAVITGPNMAGKSTYIRQVALAVILAQAGAFVPAASARIGVVDRVFTRVGAGDELARNLSTFMVEMAETAAILNHATRRSLVVLDEVGRGTSTFDGVSLAWAITEFLHDRIGCRSLFATHYHELVDLAIDRPGIANLTVSVAEQDDDVVFLHRIVPGAATKSYGIHVARLAGVPAAVVARAKEVLATLEQLNVSLTERERPTVRADGMAAPIQLTLFQAQESAALQRLKATDLDAFAPRQALDLLYELKAMAAREAAARSDP
ncbi:MAG: DNA mismatch repair protein MutS [Planctomycetes bacterium]|nr:DNA mismatch repair protein MutS [Planctomycetota bacterium]